MSVVSLGGRVPRMDRKHPCPALLPSLPSRTKPMRRVGTKLPHRNEATAPHRNEATAPRRNEATAPRRNEATAPRRNEATAPRRNEANSGWPGPAVLRDPEDLDRPKFRHREGIRRSGFAATRGE